MKKDTPSILPLSALLTAILLSGCGGSETESQVRSAASDAAPADALFLEHAPAEAQPLRTVLETAEAGADVAVRGQIGGTLRPFGEGYAIFVLADESIAFCNETPDDACRTPWDACCEDPAKIEANRVLVQFTDEAGDVLPIGLRGVGGLQELDAVVVVGTLEAPDAQGNRILQARGVYREPAAG